MFCILLYIKMKSHHWPHQSLTSVCLKDVQICDILISLLYTTVPGQWQEAWITTWTFPTKTHYELSQSGQPRTTLKNGELPCLATSSTYVWSKALDRTFSGKEKLRTLLFPLEKLSWTNLHTEGVLARMAGNGMFLPSVGWSMLAHILCVRWLYKRQDLWKHRGV